MSFSRAASWASHLVRLKRSTILAMYCFGDERSETFSFSPRARRSRSRWRIFSRSSATDFIRLLSTSGASTGMANVNTVATAATAASSAVSCLTPMLYIESTSVHSIGCYSEVEVDHLLHHEHAHAHPHGASRHHESTHVRRPKQFDVV